MDKDIVIRKISGLKEIFGVDISIYMLNDKTFISTDKSLTNINEDIVDIILGQGCYSLDGITYEYDVESNMIYIIQDTKDMETIVQLIRQYIIKELHNNPREVDIIKQIILDNNIDDSLVISNRGLYEGKQFIYISRINNGGVINLIENIWPDSLCMSMDKDIVVLGDYKEEIEINSLYDTVKSECYIEPLIIAKSRIEDIAILRNTFNIVKSMKDKLTDRQDGRMVYIIDKNILKFVLLSVDRDMVDTIVDIGNYSFDTIAKDRELYHTIEVFLGCNLNISEASRQLYIHRNTLVYRLNKIHKVTGLDIRELVDAITCKALMVFIDND